MGSSAFALGAAGLSLAGGVSEGIAKKTAGQIESVRLKQAAEAAKVRAVQVSAAYLEERNNVESTMSAIRASQNVGFDSPTAFALFDKAREANTNARLVAMSNERLKALGLEGDAAAAWKRSEMARTTALLSTSASILNSASKVSGSDMAGFFKGFG